MCLKWLESLPTIQCTRTSLLLGRLSVGCILNTVLYSRLPYCCTSFYILVVQNTLYFSLNLEKVFITHVKPKLMVCSLRSHTLPLQYISLLSILASDLLLMLHRFGMICLMMFIQPLLSTHSERSSKLISFHKHIHPNFCFSQQFSMAETSAMSKVNDYSSLLFLFSAPRICL